MTNLHKTKDGGGEASSRMLEVLDMIIEDCKKDVEDFEHAPFTGKTVGELHGILEAKIEALANIVKKHIEEPTPIKAKD